MVTPGLKNDLAVGCNDNLIQRPHRCAARFPRCRVHLHIGGVRRNCGEGDRLGAVIHEREVSRTHTLAGCRFVNSRFHEV